MEFIDLKTQYEAISEQIDARIRSVLKHGQYIMGPEVKELEARLSALCGAKHCITVASGTEALLIALMAKGIGRGDEVITTPFTFVATAEVVSLVGARPVFVDIEPDTCNIDVSKIESKITSRTKAIMPVSLYGQCADMDEINAIASRHGVAVIEDAAQSFGARYKGKMSCALSEIGCTSFFPSKPLGCYGDGGAIFTSDDAIADACRQIRVHGQSARYHHTRIGVGGRMDTLQCAVVLAKLDRFPWELEQRLLAANRYRQMMEHARLPVSEVLVRPDRMSAWAQFTVRIPERNRVIDMLGSEGIPTAVHYPMPLHRQPAYVRYSGSEAYPESDRAAREVLSLPMSADLSQEDQARVICALGRALS